MTSGETCHDFLTELEKCFKKGKRNTTLAAQCVLKHSPFKHVKTGPAGRCYY